jgi:hypothetical protein
MQAPAIDRCVSVLQGPVPGHATGGFDPALFTVVVNGGVASISGRVERRSTAEMLEHSVRMVPGLVDVHSSVSWSMDDRTLEPAGRDPAFPFGPQ